MSLFRFILCLVLCVLNVESMALNGPTFTRYVPCGLGIIYFDKITAQVWHGKIQLGLYNYQYAEAEFMFEKPVQYYDFWGKKNESAHFKVLFPQSYNYYFWIKNNDDFIPTLEMFKLNDVVLCNDTIKRSSTIQTRNMITDKRNDTMTCGRPIKVHSEIFNFNSETAIGEWPWHVAIFLKNLSEVTKTTLKLQYQCGGTIISRYAILTAGHCVRDSGFTVEPSRIFLLAGVVDYSDVKNARQRFWANKVNLHPSYDDKHATADLAVINVYKFTFDEYVQPICLWGLKYEKSTLFGREAVIVGFGRTEKDDLPRHLRSIKTMVQNDTTCIYFDPRLYYSLLNEFTFCAGYQSQVGINPRNGDSGGGLVFPLVQEDHKISWTLRGVMSKCGVGNGGSLCNPRFYSVYTDIAPYYSWVLHHSYKL